MAGLSAGVIAAVPIRRKLAINPGLSPTLPPLAREALTLLHLQAVSRALRPGEEIVREGRRCTTVWLMIEGVAVRYRILREGQRQILNFLVPGDFLGTTNCCFENALYTIKALTHAVVAPIPVQKLMDLFETHPQLAAKLFWTIASESAINTERVITISRRTATERVAHFLLELLLRLRAVGLASDRAYRLPLTQEIISDALGLSIPYVNRVLQQLRRGGLLTMRDRTVVIENFEALASLADFENNYLQPLPIADLVPVAV